MPTETLTLVDPSLAIVGLIIVIIIVIIVIIVTTVIIIGIIVIVILIIMPSSQRGVAARPDSLSSQGAGRRSHANPRAGHCSRCNRNSIPEHRRSSRLDSDTLRAEASDVKYPTRRRRFGKECK